MRRETRFEIVLLCLGMLILAVMAGCSQFQARGDAAAAIDVQAANAPAIISQVQGGQLATADAQSILTANARVMQGLAATKTVNVFAYWFGKAEIFANQDYCDDLDRAATKFSSAAIRAASQPADAAYYVGREEVDFIKFKAARDGHKSP